MSQVSVSKETFCKALHLIKEQEEINERFSKALGEVGNGHFVFGSGNRYLSALLLVLKEAVNELNPDFNAIEAGAEACDVLIRCYLLDEAIDLALKRLL